MRQTVGAKRRNVSPIRDRDYDFVVIVIFDDDFVVTEGLRLSRDVVEELFDHRDYVNGRIITVTPGRLALFWASIPHQGIEAAPSSKGIWATFPLPLILSFLSGKTITVTGKEIALVTPATATSPLESNRYAPFWSADFRVSSLIWKTILGKLVSLSMSCILSSIALLYFCPFFSTLMSELTVTSALPWAASISVCHLMCSSVPGRGYLLLR